MWRLFPVELANFPVVLVTLQIHRSLYSHDDQRLFCFVNNFQLFPTMPT